MNMPPARKTRSGRTGAPLNPSAPKSSAMSVDSSEPAQSTRRKARDRAGQDLEAPGVQAPVPSKKTRKAAPAVVESLGSRDTPTTSIPKKLVKPRGRPKKLSTNNERSSNRSATANMRSEGFPQSQIDERARSPGAQSGISQTTAITSQSRAEIDLLKENSDTMIDNLIDLNQASDAILRSLVPPGLSKATIKDTMTELRIPGSTKSGSLDKRVTHFKNVAGYYGNHSYIDPDIALRAIFQDTSTEELATGPWRADEIFYDANLATLAEIMLTIREESEAALQTLQALDKSFPLSFLDSFKMPATAIGRSRLIRETIDVAVALRTQLFIKLLQMHQEDIAYDPKEILNEVFFKEGHPYTVRNWDVPGLSSDSGLPLDSVKSPVLMRVNEIRQLLFRQSATLTDSGHLDLTSLEERFLWSDFVFDIVSWIRSRHVEIRDRVVRQGGAEKISEQLSAEVAAQGPTPSAPHKGTSTSQPTQANKKFARGSKSAIKKVGSKLKKFTGAAESENGAIQVAGPPTEDMQSQQGRPLAKRSRVRGSDQRRFLDRQPNPEQVGFSQDFPTQDAGFSEPPNKRPRKGIEAGADPVYVADVVNDGPASSDPGEEGEAAEEVPPLGTAADYQRVNSTAKAKNSLMPREVQQRRPWSIDETQALLEGIAIEKNRWAKILEEDAKGSGILQRRGQGPLAQGAIKDKARNMKYDYLIAGVPLPSGFDHVMLDKKFIERLRERGIVYEQARMRNT